MLTALPVSSGELTDKITILEIKLRTIRDTVKLASINSELRILNAQYKKILRTYPRKARSMNEHKRKLMDINRRLWKTEDEIRISERKKTFNSQFIKLARSVYKLNDERFKIKQRINSMTGSFIREVKEYRGR